MSLESTMYHEAGHAALRLLDEDIFGAPLLISALPEGDTAGQVTPSGDPVDYTPEAIRSYGRILAAGAVAETLAGFKSEGHRDDGGKLSKVALLAKRGDGFIKESVDGAEFLLRANWSGVVGIVGALRESSGVLTAPHGIELARMGLHREPKQSLGLDVETTVRIAERLRPYNLKWIEDPLLSETLDEYARLRERLPWQTLATGEHWSTVYPFFHAAATGLVDILQPDIIWVGGLSAIVRICHIADGAGIAVIPHGGGGTAYGQHACYGLSAIPMIECSGPVMTEPGVPLEEKDRLPGTQVPKDGHLRPSDAPGFGLELEREWLPPFFS